MLLGATGKTPLATTTELARQKQRLPSDPTMKFMLQEGMFFEILPTVTSFFFRAGTEQNRTDQEEKFVTDQNI